MQDFFEEMNISVITNNQSKTKRQKQCDQNPRKIRDNRNRPIKGPDKGVMRQKSIQFEDFGKKLQSKKKRNKNSRN